MLYYDEKKLTYIELKQCILNSKKFTKTLNSLLLLLLFIRFHMNIFSQSSLLN